jgi:hypothetical protein
VLRTATLALVGLLVLLFVWDAAGALWNARRRDRFQDVIGQGFLAAHPGSGRPAPGAATVTASR